MRVLVACEESQRVCTAFRDLGHEAYSCDLLPCSGGHPEWHIQGDCLPLLNGSCTFTTSDTLAHTVEGEWDMIIAHPPCTHLAVSGARHFPAKQKDGRQQKAIVFFMECALARCEKVVVENPVSIMSSCWRRPDQIIQPWQFGHPVSKKTCLWLKGVPALMPTDIVEPGNTDDYGFTIDGALRYARDDDGKIISWNDPRTAVIRSRTFSGIARAMGEQWGGDVRGT